MIALLVAATLLIHVTSVFPCTPDKFGPNWKRVGDVWYAYIYGNGTWYEMDEACRRLEPGRSTLASIRSLREQQFLRKDIYPTKYSAWLSGTRVAGKWFLWYLNNSKWIQMEKITAEYWDSHEPDNKDNNEDCINMYRVNGKWYDNRCTNRYSAYCEIRC